jgi:hypothetical protein
MPPEVTMTRRAPLALLLLALSAATASAGGVSRSVTLTVGDLPGEVSETFGTVLEGQSVTLELVIANPGSEPLRIGAVRPLCGCMHETSDRVVPAGGQAVVSLTLETVGYEGETTEAALIEWVGAEVPVTRAEMRMTVEPVLAIRPRRLIRFRVAEGEAASQELELRSPRGASFAVTSAETSSELLSARVEREDGGYRLVVSLSPDAPVGMLREKVTLHTDLPTVPTLELKVTGVVRRAGQERAGG